MVDTHRIIKRMTEAGFTEAEEKIVGASMNVKRERDASAESAAELRSAIEDLRTEIAAFRADILKWFIVALVLQGVIEVTLIKLLPGFD